MTDQELLIKVKADSDAATKELGRLTKEVDKLTKQVDSNNKSFASSKKSFDSITKATANLKTQLAALAATYLSFQGAKQLVSTTADVESGFIGVAKTTGLVGEELQKLQDELLNMSTSMAGVELSGLQGVAETAGQLGIKGTDNILEFTRVITMMGTATDLSAEEAATAMAKLGNSMGIPVTEFEKLGSVINELSNNTTATADDLVSMGQRISGAGKTFGLTADEVLAFSATLTDVGMSAELGGTAISTVMVAMLKDVESFAKASNVSFDEFSSLIKNKPVEALKLFISEIGKLDKTAKIKALDDLGLKSSGVTQTMLKLSSATGTLTKNLQTAGDEWVRNTSLQKEYETASQGLDAQWKRVENTLKTLSYKVGNELLPKIKELIDRFVEWASTLDDAKIKEFSKDIADMASGLAEVAAMIGRFLAGLASIIAENPKVTVGLIGIIAALKTLNMLLPAVGASMASMGVKSTAMAATSATLTSSIGVLGTSLRSIIAIAGPWGVAFGAMVGAATIAFNSYQESAQRAIETNRTVANEMTSQSSRMTQISDAYEAASREMQENGSVAVSTREAIRKALEDEKRALEKTLSEWEKNADMTEEQEQAFFKMAEALGAVKASLDTLDAVFTVDVTADTSEATAKIDEIKQPTASEHTVDPNADKVLRTIADIQKPTSSVHTIYERIVPARAHGGPIPQRLAVGGRFTGSGRVPGYDPTDSDRVNAKLTGGEFVIKRRAVDAIGLSTLHAINNMRLKLPKLPRFAEGGLVGSASSNRSISQNMTPVNLNIGGQSFGLMGDREIVEAVVRYINSEGGL